MPKDFVVEMETISNNVSDKRQFFEDGAVKKETKVDEVNSDEFRSRTDSIPPPDPRDNKGGASAGPWWFSWTNRRRDPTNSIATTDIGNRQLVTRVSDSLRSMFGYAMMLAMAPFNIGFYFISLAATMVHNGVRLAFMPMEYMWRFVRRATGRDVDESKSKQIGRRDEQTDDDELFEDDEGVESDDETPPSTPVHTPAELAEAIIASTKAHAAQLNNSSTNVIAGGASSSISSVGTRKPAPTSVSPAHSDSSHVIHVAIPTPDELAHCIGAPVNLTPTPPPSPTAGVDNVKEPFQSLKKDFVEAVENIRDEVGSSSQGQSSSNQPPVMMAMDSGVHRASPPPPPPAPAPAPPAPAPSSVEWPMFESGSLQDAINRINLKEVPKPEAIQDMPPMEVKTSMSSVVVESQMPSQAQSSLNQSSNPPPMIAGNSGVHHAPPPPPPPPAPAPPSPPHESTKLESGSLQDAINNVNLKEVEKPEAIKDLPPLEVKTSMGSVVIENQMPSHVQSSLNLPPMMAVNSGVHHAPPPPPPPPAPSPPSPEATKLEGGSLQEAINSINLKEVQKPEAIKDMPPMEVKTSMGTAMAGNQTTSHVQSSSNQPPLMAMNNGVHQAPPPPPPPAPSPPSLEATKLEGGSLQEAIKNVNLKEVEKPEAIKDMPPMEVKTSMGTAMAGNQMTSHVQSSSNQPPLMAMNNGVHHAPPPPPPPPASLTPPLVPARLDGATLQEAINNVHLKEVPKCEAIQDTEEHTSPIGGALLRAVAEHQAEIAANRKQSSREPPLRSDSEWNE